VFGGERQRIYMVVLTKDAFRSSAEMVGIGKSSPAKSAESSITFGKLNKCRSWYWREGLQMF